MKCILSCLLLLLAHLSYCQNSPDRKFKIEIVNHSRYKVLCVLSDVFIDSVAPGRTLKIDRPITGKHDVPGYLRFAPIGADNKDQGYLEFRRVIYDQVAGRRVVINKDNTIDLQSNHSENWLQSMLENDSIGKSDAITEKAIRDNPDDLATVDLILSKYVGDAYSPDKTEHYYNLLSDRVKHSAFGNYIANFIKRKRAFKEGALVEDITLKDTSGFTRSLSGINSNYVLIDFWFSYCHACLESFPELITLYKRTDRRQLEVIGISIDDIRLTELWKQTIAKNDLPWINWLDEDYSIFISRFALGVCPTTILLDSSRHIVKINPSIDDIDKIISQ